MPRVFEYMMKTHLEVSTDLLLEITFNFKYFKYSTLQLNEIKLHLIYCNAFPQITNHQIMAGNNFPSSFFLYIIAKANVSVLDTLMPNT